MHRDTTTYYSHKSFMFLKLIFVVILLNGYFSIKIGIIISSYNDPTFDEAQKAIC